MCVGFRVRFIKLFVYKYKQGGKNGKKIMRIINEKTLKRQYKKVLKELTKCQKALDFAVAIRDGVI